MKFLVFIFGPYWNIFTLKRHQFDDNALYKRHPWTPKLPGPRCPTTQHNKSLMTLRLDKIGIHQLKLLVYIQKTTSSLPRNKATEVHELPVIKTTLFVAFVLTLVLKTLRRTLCSVFFPLNVRENTCLPEITINNDRATVPHCTFSNRLSDQVQLRS